MSLLDRVPWNGSELVVDAAEPGQWIGPYQLQHKLGEGGMGRVFRAEQEEPVRRQVALKILRFVATG